MESLVCLLLLGLLPSADAPAAPVHLAIWHPLSPRADKALRGLADRFHRMNPSVRLAVMRYPAEDAYRLLMNWSRSDTWSPDLVVMSELWLDEFADSLTPLPKKPLQVLRSRLPACIARRMRAGDSEVAIPWWIEPRLLFYWPRLVGKRDWKPRSWQEVLDAARSAARRRHVWGLGIPGAGLPAAEFFTELLWGLQGSLHDASGEFSLQTPSAEEALSLVVQADRDGACEPQLLTWSQDELEKAFSDQKLACLVTRGSFEAELPSDKEGKHRWSVAALPAETPFVTASIDCFVIARQAEQPRAAARFLAFVLSSEGQAQIAEAGGLPVDARLAALSSSPSVRTAGTCLKTLRGLPHEKWRPLLAAVEKAFYVAVSGRRSVSRALEDAQEAYNQTLYGH